MKVDNNLFTGNQSDPTQQSAGTLEQLTLLADLSQDFVKSMDIDDILMRAVKRIKSYMDAEAASIFLVDREQVNLVCRASAGPVDVTDMAIKTDTGIIGRTFTTGESQMIIDAKKDADFICHVDTLTGFQTKSVLCTPLIIQSQTIGVLQVLNKLDEELFQKRDSDILRLLATPISLAVQNARFTLNFVEQKRIKKELTLARKLQRSLLPGRLRPPFPVVGTNISANEVSGDFYDYFELNDGTVGFIIGDVSGKGLDASMLMVRASSLLRWIGKDQLPPGQWLAKANKELCEKASRGLFVCAAVGYYNPKTDVATWSNAGLPPVIYKCPQCNIKTWNADAPPLGIKASDLSFEQQSMKLNQGGLYLLTDGLTDARNQDNQRRELDGIIEDIKNTESESPEVRIGKLITSARRHTLNDDATVLLIEKRDHLQEKVLLAQQFKASPCQLKEVRHQIHQVAASVGFNESCCQQIILSMDEAITNIIRHAYKGMADGEIELEIKQQNKTLVFYLRDFAPEVYDSTIKPRDLSNPLPGQMGINFIDSVMDSWEFATPKDGYGNLLIMKKEID
ncbi:SpoIIE family protein phosphatase [Marinicella sp. S1101]|uniref:ATP-binding SpoIIE family protein phosphatase n=1 Tax=Marinicella marina TaxID=2996016 RepID=UPI002260E7D4|nr:SpoIIE family protein phosphatase [Marinicella marina]MCX7552667.1 SpoIIE family protein phosphatase [Marinicella marina]MDJ1139543.1 SpoIIE family protein phosphatase [Marinicella marina]